MALGDQQVQDLVPAAEEEAEAGAGAEAEAEAEAGAEAVDEAGVQSMVRVYLESKGTRADDGAAGDAGVPAAALGHRARVIALGRRPSQACSEVLESGSQSLMLGGQAIDCTSPDGKPQPGVASTTPGPAHANGRAHTTRPPPGSPAAGRKTKTRRAPRSHSAPKPRARTSATDLLGKKAAASASATGMGHGQALADVQETGRQSLELHGWGMDVADPVGALREAEAGKAHPEAPAHTSNFGRKGVVPGEEAAAGRAKASKKRTGTGRPAPHGHAHAHAHAHAIPDGSSGAGPGPADQSGAADATRASDAASPVYELEPTPGGPSDTEEILDVGAPWMDPETGTLSASSTPRTPTPRTPPRLPSGTLSTLRCRSSSTGCDSPSAASHTPSPKADSKPARPHDDVLHLNLHVVPQPVTPEPKPHSALTITRFSSLPESPRLEVQETGASSLELSPRSDLSEVEEAAPRHARHATPSPPQPQVCAWVETGAEAARGWATNYKMAALPEGGAGWGG